jgi:hypothetical protein
MARVSDSIVKQLSAVIVREGGRASILETAVLEPRCRRILDARLRGHDGGVKDITPHPRGVLRPSFAFRFTLSLNGGRRKAGCWLHPWAPCNKKHGGRATGSTEAFRLSLRDGVTAYFALSPVTGLSCHRHLSREFGSRKKLSASVGAPGPHDFAVRTARARQSHATRPPHLTATFVTIASRPSFG